MAIKNYTKWLKLSQLAKRQRIKEQGLKVLKSRDIVKE